jgi:hypothetical protein
MCGGSVQLKTKVRCPFDVSKDAFDQLEVSIGGSMHEQTNLLYGISKIRPSECQVLDHTGEASI